MTPTNPNKFNKPHGKTKYFPIKQFRFDTSKHPINQTKEKCTNKLAVLLSHQESQMMIALVNSLQSPSREAIRIMLYELSTSVSNAPEKTIRYILAKSTERGHTSRNKQLEIRLPESEKTALLDKAKALGITEKEAIRLAIVHLEKSIRAGETTTLTNSKILSQGECWDAWKADRKEPTNQLDSLKKARDEGLERKIDHDDAIYERRGEMMSELIYEGGYIPLDDEGNIRLDYIDSMIHLAEEEEYEFSFEQYINDNFSNVEEMEEREKRIIREIYNADLLDINLTRKQAEEYVDEELRKEKEEKEYIDSGQADRDLEEQFAEYEREREAELEEELEADLGSPLSNFPKAEVQRLKNELKTKKFNERRKKDRESFLNSPLVRRARAAERSIRNRDDSKEHYMIQRYFNEIYEDLSNVFHPDELERICNENIYRKFLEDKEKDDSPPKP